MPEDLVLAARREEIDWENSEGVRDCSNAKSGHRQVCGSDTQENSIEVVYKRIQNEEARLDSTSSTRLLNCSLQCHLSKLSSCLSQS